ncbi:MAG: Unknown protein [uncultured Sulfurovum sp.]|uniref:Uncharacterized protein n=1 Tax=uncultured Sulfurovum sp. TaxID=269237 RepID=A0A6S6SE49_9BACT|nr:MAG: Unknown protein [uncultured Sulfurovum sp.]
MTQQEKIEREKDRETQRKIAKERIENDTKNNKKTILVAVAVGVISAIFG